MVSRVEAGSIAAEMSTVDISAISADCAELYEPVADEAGLTLEDRYSARSGGQWNRELIGQAIFNLLEMRFKYAGESERCVPICVTLVKTGEGVRLSVADNGPGIPENKRSEVVKRFVRLDESRSKPGTGLGLSLVEAVMELHGGGWSFQPRTRTGERCGPDGNHGFSRAVRCSSVSHETRFYAIRCISLFSTHALISKPMTIFGRHALTWLTRSDFDATA